MSTLSITIIAKNEESVIERCLKSISPIADEIIFVDTGSTDKTVEIAKKFTDKIYYFEWINDFAAARNYCNSLATCEFASWWDADFEIKPEYLKKLIERKKRNFDGANFIDMNWVMEYTGDKRYKTWIKRVVFFKREDFYYKYPIHVNVFPKEGVEVKEVFYNDIFVDHLKDKEVKKHRYKQTDEAMERAMKMYPDDPYLLFHYVSGLMFSEQYSKAIKYIKNYLEIEDKKLEEKRMIGVEYLIYCNLHLGKYADAKILANQYFTEFEKFPRFILIYADVTSLFDLAGAKEFYIKYLNKKFKPTDTNYSFDNERYTVHPYFMLGKIESILNNFGQSKKYLNKALSLAKDPEMIVKITQLKMNIN